jgi:hypothetical protein
MGQYLTQCKEKDVIPGKKYYLRMHTDPNIFYPTVFDPIVEWKTIQDFVKIGKVWQESHQE